MRLTSIKLDKLSDVSIAIGQVFFASALVEPIVSGKASLIILVLGIVLSITSFIFSILLHDYFGNN
ncbi:MAG: hypothetical protein AAB861_03890 [Patescibacteria group bacterium]